MTDASFVLLEDRGVLAVEGPDRRPFLQGLVSNDVEKVGPATARYAALLTAQGKYLHDFIMIEGGESIWLDAEAARVVDLKRRLSLYRLRAKISLDERRDLAVAAVLGEDALAVFGLPKEVGAARSFGLGIAFVDPRLATLGARAILPCDELRSALLDCGLAEVGFEVYDRLRLCCGIPDSSRDLIVERSILLESGFEELNGVDWQKGCYVGQELTARTKYRGLVKRRLVPVQIEGPAPPPGTAVIAGGREIGELRSSRDGLGLALLRIDAVLEGRKMAAQDTAIIPVQPEWMRLDTNVVQGDPLS